MCGGFLVRCEEMRRPLTLALPPGVPGGGDRSVLIEDLYFISGCGGDVLRELHAR